MPPIGIWLAALGLYLPFSVWDVGLARPLLAALAHLSFGARG